MYKYDGDTSGQGCTNMTLILVGRGVQIKKWRSTLEIQGSRRVTRRKFNTKGPKILGGTVKKFTRHGDMSPGISALLLVSSFAISAWGYK